MAFSEIKPEVFKTKQERKKKKKGKKGEFFAGPEVEENVPLKKTHPFFLG